MWSFKVWLTTLLLLAKKVSSRNHDELVGASTSSLPDRHYSLAAHHHHLHEDESRRLDLNQTLNETDSVGEHHDEEDGENHDEEDEEHHDDEDDHDEEDGGDNGSKPWGAVILASFFINLASLSGLVVVVLGIATKKWYQPDKSKRSKYKCTSNMVPSFACGALIATTCFLIVPEAIGNITSALMSEIAEGEEEDGHEGHRSRRFLEDEEDHDDHADDIDSAIAWRFGVCFATGFLFPIFSSLIFPHYHEPEICDNCQADIDQSNAVGTTEEVQDLTLVNSTLCTRSKGDEACPCDDCHEPENVHVCHDDDDNDHDHHDHSKEPQVHSHTHSGHGQQNQIGSGHAHSHDHHDHGTHRDTDRSGLESVSAKSIDSKPKPINYALATSILVGDFFHNFTDGILLGTAFSLCNRDLAITIAIATVYHELAQEIADFFLLTKHCNLTIPVALTLNFLGGLSVLLGAVLILSFPIGPMVTGCILSIGSGVYVHIAAVECLPRAQEAQENTTEKLISVVCFIVGVIPIGLVLLNHQHCEA